MNEYISKKTIIDALEEENERQPFQPTSIYSCVIPFIRKLPAADVQPVKHGRWKSSANTIESGTVKCDNCRSEMYIDDLLAVSASNDNLPNYCPNCGARMGGGDKDDS